MLTSDGSRTFAMFRYEFLGWHTPYYTGTSGQSHGPATAGVNGGDKVNGFNVTDDSNNILDLVSMSNVHKPGLFVYQLSCQVSSLHNL